MERSFIALSAIARSRVGRPGGAAPRSRSLAMAAAALLVHTAITDAHSARTSSLVQRASAHASVTAR
jgi:hypothetical protein